MNLVETLKGFDTLRQDAIQQEKDFKEGKRTEAPTTSVKSVDMMEKVLRNFYGDVSKGKASISEAISTTDTIKLIPKVIEGQLREAAEPQYLATNFFKTINVDGNSGTVYVVPVVGELTATEVAEGGRYNEDAVDMNTFENSMIEVRVKKIGTKVSITEEAIADSSWDVLGMNIRKMGRAMARYKEDWAFNNFSDHGHVIFDNNRRTQIPELGTTGRNHNGDYNDTLSTEDFLDMVLGLMGNGFNPTDIIMHPLTWVVFARNSMIGNGLSYGAFGGQQVHPWGATQGTNGFAGLPSEQGPQRFIMSPDQVQGRLPMPITVNFSPFVKFDKVTRKFDMYCIDREEVGVIAQRDALSTDNWTDPERDIRLLKCKERYGIGIINNGRAITVARNIAVAPSYPIPPSVVIATKEEA